MKYFSHIYYEEEARGYPLFQIIRDRFPDSIYIPIKKYQQILNRKNQDFSLQKNSPKLVLAVEKENFIYPSSYAFADLLDYSLYYTSQTINCLFDCSYCFLQGMYESSYPILFVNIEDFFKASIQEATEKKICICPSFESDILGMEHWIPLTKYWMEFLATNPRNIMAEIRTKSGNFRYIADKKKQNNLVLAWTLTPENYRRQFENKTPSIKIRLKNIKDALQSGFQVKICLEPLILERDWKKSYSELLSEIQTFINCNSLFSFQVHFFRMNQLFFKKIQKKENASSLFFRNYTLNESFIDELPEVKEEAIHFFKTGLKSVMDEEKLILPRSNE